MVREEKTVWKNAIDEYMKLEGSGWEQNIRNERDANIDEKVWDTYPIYGEKCKGYCAGHFAWAYDDFRGNNSFDFKV